jgi:hypothetical protein
MQVATHQPHEYVIMGTVVTLPCEVREAKAAHVLYAVPAAAATRFLGPELEPLEHEPGQSQLVLGFVDYLDNDLGQYREVMIVFFVRPRGRGSEAGGTYIYKLPVDGEFTCAAGREIWGFPKTVEQIDLDYAPERAQLRLVMDGKLVFGLSVPRSGGLPAASPPSTLLTYTYRPELHVVPFTSGSHGAWLFPGGNGVELQLGDHPIANELRSLGLPATPLVATWAEHFYGSFGAPELVR